MLSRENIICCVTSVLLIAYMVVTFVLTNNGANAATAPDLQPVLIEIEGGDENRFVTGTEVRRIIAPLLPGNGEMVMSQINTHAIEQMLAGVDNIEWARCSRTSRGRLKVEIRPMSPVARVFDGDSSYYINRQGKRLTASLRYRSDVPVVQGHIIDAEHARSLLPLLDTINSRPELAELVTSLKIDGNGDVLLVPSICGHLVNFGSPLKDISNKFARLTVMYSEVMPVKGWDFYDTISVKFSNRIVATRRDPGKRQPEYIADPEGDAAESRSIEGNTDTSAPVETEVKALVHGDNPQPDQPTRPVDEPAAPEVPHMPDEPAEPELPTIMID